MVEPDFLRLAREKSRAISGSDDGVADFAFVFALADCADPKSDAFSLLRDELLDTDAGSFAALISAALDGRPHDAQAAIRMALSSVIDRWTR